MAGRTGTAIVTVTVSDGQATGSVQVTVRVGGNGNDTLTGGAATNLLFGQNGNDTLTGGGGIRPAVRRQRRRHPVRRRG